MDSYCFLHLRGAGNSADGLLEDLPAVVSGWAHGDIAPWGIWRGLFGVASNELVVMAASEYDRALEDFQPASARIQILQTRLFHPTVRPENRTPCQKPGIYVFRFFSVADDDVEEFVALSTDAWTTFERADDYAAEPQGLFRSHTDGDSTELLLVTWYDSLQSWQTSRQPAPQARERFARRRALTRSTVAIATALVVD